MLVKTRGGRPEDSGAMHRFNDSPERPAMYQRIFVPFDGSGPSLQGLDQAIALAKSSSARLRVAYEIDELIGATGFESYAIYARDVLAAMRRTGEGILALARERANEAGIAAETELFESGGHNIAARIVEHAMLWQADLIVIGSHGRRGAPRFFMGSDAENIVRLAPMPVLVVREAHAAAL